MGFLKYYFLLLILRQDHEQRGGFSENLSVFASFRGERGAIHHADVAPHFPPIDALEFRDDQHV
jgi:hypothetical protein